MTFAFGSEQFQNATRERTYLSGVEALRELLIIQSQRDRTAGLQTAGFCSGYRGSPLSGLDQILLDDRERLGEANVVFRPGINEELAATAVWGSQQVGLADKATREGVFAVWYAKAPGVDRAADALRHANFAGTHPRGGVLALLGDDHSCKSSTLPSFSEPIARHLAMPILYPANVQELLDFGVLGYAMSRLAGLWVGLKCLIDTMDASAPVDLAPDRVSPVVPDDVAPGTLNIRWPDAPLDQERRMFESKLPAALSFARANGLNPVLRDDAEARVGIISAGKSYLDTLQALDLVEDAATSRMPARLLKLGMVWPLDADAVRAFAAGLDHIVVVEEKAGLIEEQVRSALYANPPSARPTISGKTDLSGRRLFPEAHELTSDTIATVLAERWLQTSPNEALQRFVARQDDREEARGRAGLPPRMPYFCAGCPHNTSTTLPDGSRAFAGIGCHYMSQWMDRDTGFYSQMGGEGAAWNGIAPFVERSHVFANLGDGTFNHSGSLAIRAAIAAGVNITYKILFNDAVAMTGGQAHDGDLSVERIARLVLAEGVRAVRVVTDDEATYRDRHLPPGVVLLHRSRLDEVQRELRGISGVTVLIYDQGCATEKRRKRKRGELPTPETRVLINPEVCEGCGDCGRQSNCVAIQPLETSLGLKRAINQSACNSDYSCLAGFCPSFVTIKVPTGRRANTSLPPTPQVPEPKMGGAQSRACNIVVAGVGGTGVVSVGAILGRAAAAAGRDVNVLDMIGMAQKGGQVISQIRVAGEGHAVSSMRVPKGRAHLLLGCDALTAASRDALAFCGTETVVVTDSAPVPSSDFTRDADYRFPGREVLDALRAMVGRDNIHLVDATAEAVRTLGDAIFANTILLGYACQIGALPVSAQALEVALGGPAGTADRNLFAFRQGRELATRKAADGRAGFAADAPLLDRRLDDLTRRLTDYQDAAYAKRFLTRINRLREIERERCGSEAVTGAAALSLYRLMAYKDEYEVARLHLAFRRALKAEHGAGLKITHYLAPPALAGRDPAHMATKRKFATGIGLTFALLSRLRWLRGSALDPFGHTSERKTERDLVRRFLVLLDEIECDLSPANHLQAIELAGLGGEVRGYGHVKGESIRAVDAKWRDALLEFRQGPRARVAA